MLRLCIFSLFTLLSFSLAPSLFAMEGVLGLQSKELFNKQGYPDDIAPVRGETELEDTILVSYNDGLAFVLWENAVKGLQVDKRYRGNVMGLYMGMSPEDAYKVLNIEPEETVTSQSQTIVRQKVTTGMVEMALFFFEGKLLNLSITLV